MQQNMEIAEQVLSSKQILIMETAEKLFATNGYDATSIRDIATAGSFNSAMISYYFGSKEQLLEGILVYRNAKLSELVDRVLQEEKYPLDKILAMTDFYIEKVFQQRDFYLLIYQIQSLPEKYQLIRNFYNTLRYQNFELIDAIVQDGITKGLFKSDVDTSFLMFLITGTINQMILNKEYYRGLNKMENLSDGDFEVHMKQEIKALMKSTITATVSA
jgi:AcrR family transcriptional regulator